MKAHELRIGNYVSTYRDAMSSEGGRKYLDGKDHLYSRVTGILPGRLIFDGQTPNCVNIEDADPIPLSEELLLNCGFEEYYEEDIEDGITDYYQKNGIVFSRRYGTIVDCVTHEQIHYLHQLQNLYFALTGEELQITLP